jgi:hypothetical protein
MLALVNGGTLHIPLLRAVRGRGYTARADHTETVLIGGSRMSLSHCAVKDG